jgi:hypothetical protein
MGDNTLQTEYSGTVLAKHPQEIVKAICGAFVPRDQSTGTPKPGMQFGKPTVPWGTGYFQAISINGQLLDTSQLTVAPNRLINGRTRTLSKMPDFLRADGTVGSFTLLATDQSLTLSIAGNSVSVETDQLKTGMVLAPSSNNTALVNMSGLSNSLHAGEDGGEIILDTVGTEIISKVGQTVAFKTPTGEILIGFLKESQTLTNVFRGYAFDNLGNPLTRGNLSDDDQLTLLNTGTVFLEDNGITIDVTTLPVQYAFQAPTSPVVGQYWFDIQNGVYKRYNGAEWEIINRMPIGLVFMDDTACIATRSFDFDLDYDDLNSIELELASTEILQSINTTNKISVYGDELVFKGGKMFWNITTSLLTGLTEASDQFYYIYVTEKGQLVGDIEKPYSRSDLMGYYHPHHSWRCIARLYNNASGDLAEERNYFIWQKYAPHGFIPDTFTAYFDAGGTLVRESGEVGCVNGNASHTSTGSYTINLKPGFFHDDEADPIVSLTTTGGVYGCTTNTVDKNSVLVDIRRYASEVKTNRPFHVFISRGKKKF